MRRWIIIAVIVIAVIGIGGYFYVQSQGGWEAFRGQTADATPTPLPVVQSSPEVIVDAVVVPARFASLSLPTSGIVASVLVNEGERVEQGQVIAQLENERQVIAIAQAEARVRAAQARIQELRAGARTEEIQAAQSAVDIAAANLANLQEGSRPEEVNAAQAALAAAQAAYQRVLDGADDAQLIAAEADLANAEAAVRQAQSAYDQVSWRNDISALPQSAELERATNNLAAAQARYDDLVAGAEESDIAAARAEVQRAQAALDKAISPATASQIAAAEAQVRQAEAQLALLQAGARPETLAMAEAELTEAQTALMQQQVALQDTQLTAPFAGTVASLNLEVGEQVVAGSPVAQLADLTEWHIETDDLTEINVVYVREGDRVIINVDALPDLELAGTVLRIKPLGENKQGDITYTATIVPDEHDNRLLWNMTAAVTIQTGDQAAAR